MKKEYLRGGLFIAILLLVEFKIVETFNLPRLWTFYGFTILFILSGITILLIAHLKKTHISMAGYSFIGMMFVKTLMVIVFLGLFSSTVSVVKPFILNFSILYLIFLFLTMYIGLKILNK
jgi:hypothetical protein